MRVLIRGAGDIATGIALRLCRARLQVVMTDLASPPATRRTVCFSQAIVYGTAEVEGIRAVYAKDCAEAERIMAQGDIPVLADPDCACRRELKPDALVDAILAKRNLGTTMTDAPVVVGIGPGFTAGGGGLPRRGGDYAGPYAGPRDLSGQRTAQYQYPRPHRRLCR